MLKNNDKNEVPTYRSLILTQGRGKDRQNEKKIVLELFASMLVIHQNGRMTHCCETWQTVIIFNILLSFTFVHFQGGVGSEKVYGLYSCENDDNYG